MSISIIPHLVKKDWLLTRKMVLVCCLICITAVGILYLLYGRIPNWVFMNVAFTMLLDPAATCGIILLMMTNVFEKEKSTQVFILSLPVTVKQFTIAKLLINLPVFSVIWLAISGFAFYFAFGLGLFPHGTAPFITIIFVGVFVAYTFILSASLLFQSLGITVFSIMFFELATTAYLWVVAFMEPIARNMYSKEAVWNSTAIAILITQLLVSIAVICLTLFIQNKKKDFV